MKKQPEMDLDTYEVEEGWFTHVGGLNEEDWIPDTLINVLPFYTINDEKRALPLMKKIIQTAKHEEGCLYFGKNDLEALVQFRVLHCVNNRTTRVQVGTRRRTS